MSIDIGLERASTILPTDALCLQNAGMTVVLTIRDVPDDVRIALVRQARERGQSLQAYLLSILRQEASFSRNRQLLTEARARLALGGGAGPEAPDSADVIRQARAESEWS